MTCASAECRRLFAVYFSRFVNVSMWLQLHFDIYIGVDLVPFTWLASKLGFSRLNLFDSRVSGGRAFCGAFVNLEVVIYLPSVRSSFSEQSSIPFPSPLCTSISIALPTIHSKVGL